MTSIRIGPVSIAVAAATAALAAALTLSFAGPARAAEGDLNACGCRQTGQGLCTCEKKSKCGCPGECEPKGCEEKRAKQLEKEIQAETKKAEEASRRQSQAGRKGRGGEDDTGPAADTTERSAAARPAPKMTAAQKKDLARLLGLYLADHPDQGATSVEVSSKQSS